MMMRRTFRPAISPASFVEVGRNRDHGLRNLLAQVILGRLLHLLEDDGRNLLRGVLTSVDVHARGVVVALDDGIGSARDVGRNLVVGLTHETLDREDRALGVGDRLTLRGVADLTLAVGRESHDRRGRAVSLGVGDYNRLVALHHCHAGVRGS